jgi:hypothetical protein
MSQAPNNKLGPATTRARIDWKEPKAVCSLVPCLKLIFTLLAPESAQSCLDTMCLVVSCCFHNRKQAKKLHEILDEHKSCLEAAKEGRDLDLEVTASVEHGTSEFDIVHSRGWEGEGRRESGRRRERGEGRGSCTSWDVLLHAMVEGAV